MNLEPGVVETPPSVLLQEETDAGNTEEVDGGGASSSPEPLPEPVPIPASKLNQRLQVRYVEGCVIACSVCSEVPSAWRE